MRAIGHSNNTNPTANYNTALTAAKEKTPGELALERESAKTLDWASKGDYRDPHSGGLFVNFADPAMLHRNRELEMNAGDQGIFALGEADPNYLASVKENMKAHQEEADAGQYESDVKEGVGAAAGVAGDTSKLDLSRKLGVLGTTATLQQQQANKPKWWNYAIQGASAAAPFI